MACEATNTAKAKGALYDEKHMVIMCVHKVVKCDFGSICQIEAVVVALGALLRCLNNTKMW